MNITQATAVGRNLISRVFLNVKQYGAKGDGRSDDTTAFANCIAAATAAGMPVFVPATSAYYLVTSLSIPSNCRIIGQTSNFALGGGPTIQTNTPNASVLVVPFAATQFRVTNLNFNANASGSSSVIFNGGTDFIFDFCSFNAPSSAPTMSVQASILFFQFHVCQFSGGSYNFDVIAAANFGTQGEGFSQCTFGGWATNSLRLASTAISTNFRGCNWNNHSGGNSAIVFTGTAGTILPCSFLDCSAEAAVGSSQTVAYTTGTISASSNSLTVASATGLVNGRGITVQGAGSNAEDLTTTITGISGTTITLAANASTSVTNSDVAMADYSFFDNSAGGSVNLICIGHITGADNSLYLSNRCQGTFINCSCTRPIYTTANNPVHMFGYGAGVQGAPFRSPTYNYIQQGTSVGGTISIGSPMFALGPSASGTNGPVGILAAPQLRFALTGTHGQPHGDFVVSVDSAGWPEKDMLHVYGGSTGNGPRVSVGAPMDVPSYAYNALPPAQQGAHIYVTGTGQTGWGTQLDGTTSGTNNFPAWSNGTNWFIG